MKRNTLRRIKRQLKEAEAALNELPVELAESMEHNGELNIVKIMDDLSKITDAIDFVMDDSNGYKMSALCKDDNPDKEIWYDPIGQNYYAPFGQNAYDD